jgi:hypothetical protein
MNTEIQGCCDVVFLPLRDAFLANFEDGLEIGASLAATHRGRMVADMWAGYANPGRTRLWEQDTIVPVASTTKSAILSRSAVALPVDTISNAKAAKAGPMPTH